MAKTIKADTLVNTDGTGGPVDAKYGVKGSLTHKDILNADYAILDLDGFGSFTSSTTLTANRTITLPVNVAGNIGREFFFQKLDSSAFQLIIDTPGAETIAGAATNALNAQGSWLRIKCVSATSYIVMGVMDYMIAAVTTDSATVATNLYGDITSLAVPAGIWDMTANLFIRQNGATYTNTNIITWVGSVAGNNATDQLESQNIGQSSQAIAAAFIYVNVLAPAARKILTATTTYYAKYKPGTYSAGSPLQQGSLIARRVG